MSMIGKVRRMHFREKKSVREIARLTSLSRNTVRTWLREPEVKDRRYRRPATSTQLTPYADVLRQALAVDARRAKREQRTVKALFEALKAQGYTGCYSRVSNSGQTRYDWQHYVPLVQRKPGALRNGEPFAELPQALQTLRRALLREAGGDRVMAQVLALVPQAGLEAVMVAAELTLEAGPPGRVSVEHVVNVLNRLNASATPDAIATHLRAAITPQADTARYDRLRDREVEHAS